MRDRRLRAGLLVLAAVLAAACGRGDEEPAAPPGAAADDEGREVVLRRGNPGEPGTLDPQRAEEETSREIIRDLFEGLVTEAPDGSLVPGAAESWSVSDDGLTWTFTLRGSGRWSNGDPLTAADFVAGLRRAVDPATGSTSAALLSPIANAGAVIAGEAPVTSLGVDAPDEHTLVIELESPTPYLLGLLSNTFAFPVHGPSLQAHGAGHARPGRLVSNGAYMLDDWQPQRHVRLKRNARFRSPPAIDVVYFFPLEDPAAELNRYRADELDITSQIPHSRFRWLKENLGEELHVAPYLSTQFWMFNMHRAPFDDIRLRKALTMAVDRERLVESVTGLGEVPAYGLVPPGTANYTAQSFEWRDWPMERRLETARALLGEAGYGPDRPLVFEVRYNTDENLRRVATAVAAMWREHLPVEATLVNEELRVMLAKRRDPALWEVMRLAWAGDYNDASNFLEILPPGGAVDDTGFSDPEYVRLLEAAAAENDPAARRRLLEAAELIVLERYPILPLYYTVSKHLVKPWVKGFAPNVLNHVYSRHLSIDTAMRGF
ncbi:MAG: peptide ABC transporter substrate-binding protein [Gammaproteobacteria bacterium]